MNELPDPNYATLKFLMGHLDKFILFSHRPLSHRKADQDFSLRIKSREHANQMSGSNLAIVFGPNLLGAPPSNNGTGQGTALADMSWQCKCVETILQHYVEIFVVCPLSLPALRLRMADVVARRTPRGRMARSFTHTTKHHIITLLGLITYDSSEPLLRALV